MKKILVIALSFLVSACANKQYIVENANDPTEIAAKIYEVKSEFGEHRIYGPGIVRDFGGLLYNDTLTIQLMKTETQNYYLRVHNFHSGRSWKFIESITTLEKETIDLQDVSRETRVCLSSECSFTETGFAPLEPTKYLNGNKELKIRINAKRWGTQVMIIPKEYIQVFMEKVSQP